MTKRLYVKPESTHDEYSVSDEPKVSFETITSDNGPIKYIHIQSRMRSYEKVGETKKEISKIILLCEDSRDSPKLYFQRLEKYQIRGVNIHIVTCPQNGIPVAHMLRRAREAVEYLNVNYELGDKVYLICDLDHYREDLIEISPICNKNQWQLIISNPCIELWFYYHFLSNPPQIEPCSKEDKNSGVLKTYCGSVVSGGIDPRKLWAQTETAIKNSKQNYAKEDDGFIPRLWATDMHLVAEEIWQRVQEDTI